MKTAAVHSRIDPAVKKRAESILARLGLSPTDAIRLFYKQITLRKGLPFDVRIPNATTLAAVRDSRRGRNLTRHKSTAELFASWEE